MNRWGYQKKKKRARDSLNNELLKPKNKQSYKKIKKLEEVIRNISKILRSTAKKKIDYRETNLNRKKN